MALLGTADKEQCGAFLVSALSSCRFTPTDAFRMRSATSACW